MDCHVCEKKTIGSIEEPIYVLSDNSTVCCAGCYELKTGKHPKRSEAQFDPELCPEERVQDRLELINELINELATEYFTLVNPTKKEAREAAEVLTDDPMNDIREIVNVETSIGQMLVADEVICQRAMEKEDALVDSQRKWIRKHYGKKAADQSNYGWFADDVCYSTKVYGHGVLTSRWQGKRVMHSFEER
jgi:hypothetical protein